MRRPPTPYSDEIAEQILERIECGETLEAIAKTDGMPSRNTIRKWQRGAAEGVPEDFPARFEAALKVRLEGFVDDLLQLPRNADPNHPGELQIVKLECENRRWLLSKLLREQFGDRAAIDVGGQRDNPLQQSEAHRRWLEEIMTAEEKETIQRITHRILQQGPSPQLEIPERPTLRPTRSNAK